MKIDVYTKDNCPWCTRAKAYLEECGETYNEILVTEDNRDHIKEKFPEAKTVPIIVFDDEWIGGYEELRRRFS